MYKLPEGKARESIQVIQVAANPMQARDNRLERVKSAMFLLGLR